MFLQVPFQTASTNLIDQSLLSSFQDILSEPLVLLVIWVVLGLLGLMILLNIARFFLSRRARYRDAFDKKVFLVRVPKELSHDDNKGDKSQQQIQEAIGVMETLFSTIGSLSGQKGFSTWMFGRTDVFGFEIVSHRDKISFYVTAPNQYTSFVEQQIHAQYPNAQIDEVPDYNIFSPMSVTLGSYLTLRRASYFPVKTYRKMESDSMNGITNTLSQVESGEGVAIQYLIRSASKDWRKEGLRIARGMHQGKKLSSVQKEGDLLASLGKGLSGAMKSPDKEDKPEKTYSLSPLEQEMVKGLEEKASKAGLEMNIRVVTSSKSPERAQRYLNDVLAAYGQFSIYEYGNSFVKNMPRFQTPLVRHFIYRHFDDRYKLTLGTEEMATVYHFPLPSTETPKINWLLSRKTMPPSNLPTEGILLGNAEYRGQNFPVHMKPGDRRRHMYMIGKSGTGKTELMKAMAQQDIENGHGVCIIDPNGDFADEALQFVPKHRADDVIFFDPGDYDRPIGLNMLEFDPAHPEQKTFVINEILKIFDKLYDLKSTGGPMFELYMRNAILLLMEDVDSGSTLLDISKVLADEDYRNYKLARCKSQQVKDFWQKEALKAGGEASLANMVPYITSKLTPFVYNDYMRPIIGQQKSSFNMREIMDGQKILILKLSKGKIGDLNAYLLGMVLVGKIMMAAFARGDMDLKDRKDFYLYIDEFQNFLTDSVSTILSEARKYALNLIIAHQFLGQLDGNEVNKKIKDAIFGNVGSMFINRIGVEDAEFLAKEFAPVLSEYDLVNIEALTFNVKLLIDNQASRPFNMRPTRPRMPASNELAKMVHELSRYKYGRRREIVEAEIAERQNVVTKAAPAPKDFDNFL